jgi:UDP-glucose 4-epimerase
MPLRYGTVRMKILVTGSSGTIGTRLCEKLLEKGHTVAGIDWVKNKWQPSINKITTLIDLRDWNAIEKANLPTFDVIVHLAANARVYDLVEDPSRAKDNMLTVFNALELARQKKIPRFIFASSREVYGNEGHQDRYSEEMVHLEYCESPYTASKVAGEALVESYTRCYDIAHIIFRFSNVYGMYDDSNRVIPLFLRLAKNNEPLTIFGEKKCLDFTYIDDTVAGIISGIEKFETAKNGTYNLAFGEGTTILHLAERVKQLLGSTSIIKPAPSRRGEVTNYIADIGRAKKALNYAPTVSFEEGIQKTAEWYKQNYN